MKRENIKTIGYMVVFIAVAAIIIFHDEISAMMGNMIMGQTDSMLDQVLR